jgi:hypothetical protein
MAFDQELGVSARRQLTLDVAVTMGDPRARLDWLSGGTLVIS